MPITKKTDLKGVVSRPNYNPSSLVVTNGIENFTFYYLYLYRFSIRAPQRLFPGQPRWLSEYYDQLGGYQPSFLPDQVSKRCLITTKRQANVHSGIYCLNIYYHTYCIRDCQMSKRDFCSCKQGGAFHTHSCWPSLWQQNSSSSNHFIVHNVSTRKARVYGSKHRVQVCWEKMSSVVEGEASLIHFLHCQCHLLGEVTWSPREGGGGQVCSLSVVCARARVCVCLSKWHPP